MRRALSVGAVLLAVSVAAGLGWMAARNVRSPTQVALEAEPPTPSPITVEVERTELVADVITRADVGYDDPVPIGLAGALGGRPSTLIVTSARERGDELVEGAVVVEVSGRPVFLLKGQIPVYRDLLPQAEGPDVLQVEEALARLGHFSEEPDGVWTPGTEAAVEAWYAAAGYQANGVSDDDQHRIDTAKEAVTSAEDRLTSAEDRLAAAVRSEEDALYNLSEARETLDEARAGPDELAIRRARSDLASAEEQEAFALADAERGVAAAERAIIDAEAQRERAAVDYTMAGSRWEGARLGVHPDTGDRPTGRQLEDLRQAVETALSDLEDAERRIDEAYEDLDRRVIETDAAVRSAGDGVAQARSSLDDLLAPPDVGAEVRAVENARNALDDARAEIEDARSAIEDAEAAVAEAEESLKDLEDRTGVWIPAGELIFLERLPVRVDLLTAERGSLVTGSFMTVSGSELAIRGSVADSDVALVKEGGEAFIEDSLLVEPLRGEIRLVADRPGTNNVASSRYYIEIVAEGIPDELIGSNVKVVIPVGGTAGEVLAVPAAALSSTADGSAQVEVHKPDGTTRFVRVEPGLSAEGLVEITPLDGEIIEGDLVVIGVASG